MGAAARTLLARGADPQTLSNQMVGVELDATEARKAAGRLELMGVPCAHAIVHQGDFFSFCQSQLLGEKLLGLQLSAGRTFDAVVGNPPFIRYQTFPETHRQQAFQIMGHVGLQPSRLTNAWAAFLVAATLTLAEGGRLAMVVPAELLQVHYAAEIRRFLSEFYGQITLVTFRQLLFTGIQQEVVLVLGERQTACDQPRAIRVVELDGLTDLPDPLKPDDAANGRKPLNHSTEKWTRYFLDASELALLNTLLQHPQVKSMQEFMEVNVGLVTGYNDFFLLTDEERARRELDEATRPLVSRSAHLEGLLFSVADWERNGLAGHPVHLFYPSPEPIAQQPSAVRRYVAEGEQNSVHRGYKCRIRPHWYHVPSFWVPDGFMLRQIHSHPKLILNMSGATCTDTIHRVRFRQGVDSARQIAGAFLNSLTFAAAEITGRSYGGGVLTFEPSEARSLPLPTQGMGALELSHIDDQLRRKGIYAVLEDNDKQLLQGGLGLSASEALKVRGMWEKMRNRRIQRKTTRKP